MRSYLPAHFPSPSSCHRDRNVQHLTMAARPVPFYIGPARIEVTGIPVLECRGCWTAIHDVELLAEIEAVLARRVRHGEWSFTYTFQELSSELCAYAA